MRPLIRVKTKISQQNTQKIPFTVKSQNINPAEIYLPTVQPSKTDFSYKKAAPLQSKSLRLLCNAVMLQDLLNRKKYHKKQENSGCYQNPTNSEFYYYPPAISAYSNYPKITFSRSRSCSRSSLFARNNETTMKSREEKSGYLSESKTFCTNSSQISKTVNKSSNFIMHKRANSVCKRRKSKDFVFIENFKTNNEEYIAKFSKMPSKKNLNFVQESHNIIRISYQNIKENLPQKSMSEHDPKNQEKLLLDSDRSDTESVIIMKQKYINM